MRPLRESTGQKGYRVTADLAQPGFSMPVEAVRPQTWLLGPGEPTAVTDHFRFGSDFTFVVDDRADVHINSVDGRFYLGWYPRGRPGTENEGWKIADTAGYSISYGTETPAAVIAAAVAHVLGTSRPARPRTPSGERLRRAAFPGTPFIHTIPLRPCASERRPVEEERHAFGHHRR